MAKKTAGKTPTTSKEKKFASLASPKDKITAADRIAGAKKAKYQKGGTTKYIDKADKNLTESIGSFNAYDMLKKERAANAQEEAIRKARAKYPVAASTYVKKPVGFKKGGSVTKMKMGGSCGTPKRLGRGK